MTSSVTLIVWSVFAALVIASVIAYTVERTLQLLALRLSHENTDSESSAKTLSELGYSGLSLSLTALCLSSGSRIGRAIGKAVPEKTDKAPRTDSELLFADKPQTRYYLAVDTADKNLQKHLLTDTPLWKLIAALLILLLAALAASSVIRFLSRSAANVPNEFSHDVYGTENKQDTLLEEQEKLTEQDLIDAEKAEKEAAEDDETTGTDDIPSDDGEDAETDAADTDSETDR